MSTFTNTTSGTTDLNLQIDDLDEFEQRSTGKWKEFNIFIKILYDTNVSIAVILALIGILLFLTILNQKLRSQSQLWYVYHLLAMTTFIAFVLHTVTHAGFENQGVCFLVSYMVEYLFVAVGVNVVLINTEVYFTSMLPLAFWRSKPFLRFIVLILTSWILVCLFVAHAVIPNNGIKFEKYHCFYIVDKSARTTRFFVRSGLPAIVCFLFTIAFIATHLWKKTHAISAPGHLREVTSVGSTNNTEWLRFIVFFNGVFLVRTATMCIVEYLPDADGDISYYYVIWCVLYLHTECMYILPLAMLFLTEVRLSVKAMILRSITVATFGKLRFGNYFEVPIMRFSQVSENNVS